MTLIVGVRCAEGVVIGADSAATLHALGQPTVRQQYDKVEIIGDKVLVAVSGPVGLGQRLVGQVADAWTNKKLAGESWEVMTTLRRLFTPHLEDEFKAAQMAQSVVGALARESVLSHTLVAIPVKKEPRLFQFDHQGAPEEAKEKLPFVCIGSGQYLADPFMAFIADLFWQKGKFPSLPDGLFATVWTIQQAINVAPGGIAGPLQVHILAKDDSDWTARRLEDSDLQEHYQAIADARSALQRFRTGFEPGEQDVPLPPPPT